MSIMQWMECYAADISSWVMFTRPLFDSQFAFALGSGIKSKKCDSDKYLRISLATRIKIQKVQNT